MQWIVDPGHGWLEVSEAEVEASGYKPTRYSYRHRGMAFLEEDVDAPAFLKAISYPFQIPVTYVDDFRGRNRYDRFEGE